MTDDTMYPHERKVLMVTLQNFIINILDSFGIRYQQNNKTFYKKMSKGIVKIATLDEIMKGIK